MTPPDDQTRSTMAYSHTLAPVLDQHTEWFGRILRHVFYPAMTRATSDVHEAPACFHAWIHEIEKGDIVQPQVLADLRRLHDDMQAAATKLLQSAQAAKAAPDIALYDSFVNLYEEFVLHIHRLERDLTLQDSGMDVMTGLRSRRVMMKDLEREMERRSRRGRPFCLALVRIDNFSVMTKNLGTADLDNVVLSVSRMIKKTIRSFDDAYRLENGEFMMCLKQADSAGGAAGINRLRRFMEEEHLTVTMGGKTGIVTLSCCVGEPQPGDKMDALMDHMRNDLDRFGTERNTAVEYIDVSPLTRFVNTLDEDGRPEGH